MATWNSPAVARRWLAHELRTRREALGLSQSAVGRACGWSGVKVSYIENAQQKSITDEELDKLLPLYEVDEAAQGDFYAAAAAAREKGWWERKYDDDVVAPYLADFIGLEQGASLIRTFEPTIIPGLLQTRDYMKAVAVGDMVRRTERRVRQIVDVREARRAVLTRDDQPAEFVALVDESVLHRVVGGPALMAAQLDFVVALMERPNISFHVFPFERGVRQGLTSASHRILHFARTEPPVVFVETQDDAQWIEDPAAVDLHDLAFEELLRSALTKDESREMVTAMRERYAARAS
ncbi:MAG TPA: helix-turn-helix transcriptional regulator [Ilumatobacter sp.]